MKRTITYLTDIIECIEKIETYIAGMDYYQYIEDSKTLDGVERNFIKLGDASNRISKDFKQKYNSVSWRDLADVRNVLTHEYKEVNDALIWDTIKKDLPLLKKEIEGILENLKQENFDT